MKKISILFLISLLPIVASAQTLIDGIYYNFDYSTDQASVASGQYYSYFYTGDIVIPETVKDDDGDTYSVTEIEEFAFQGCSELTSVTIPNSMTIIKEGAFFLCENLTSVTISNSVKSIGDNAFSRCINLTNITIGESVSSIGLNAFMACDNLKEVTIGKSVTYIGDLAFSACYKLKDVYCYAEDVPTTFAGLFLRNVIANATLHVPSASVEAYKATEPWSNFGTFAAIDPTGVKTLEGTQKNADRLLDGKYIKNGKLVIIRNCKEYNVSGAVINY